MTITIDFLRLLPNEIATQILSYLDVSTLLFNTSPVSKCWYTIAHTNTVWRQKTLQSYLNIRKSKSCSDWFHTYKQNCLLKKRWQDGTVSKAFILGHTDSVYCLQFSGDMLVTGSRDHTIKFWNITNHECTTTLKGHDASVLCLKYNQDMMVSGSSDMSVIVWDMKTKQVKMQLWVKCEVLLVKYIYKNLTHSIGYSTISGSHCGCFRCVF